VIILRKPGPDDGKLVSALVRGAPPLDANSAYCHLIQCSHFADTCVVAERSGLILGWVSAHRPPSAPDQLFVWQVAVHPDARGLGLASRMLAALAARPAAGGATALTATVTEANEPSWALFNAFARSRGARATRAPLFDRDRHFGGTQDSEWLITIAPLHPNDPDKVKE
jgi:L-2,4-diaminobutyric acid acetyltransferase